MPRFVTWWPTSSCWSDCPVSRITIRTKSPDILFFDEPSAGLDPISAKLLDDLILELRDSLGTTVVVVTHELASIFAIGNNSVFVDADAKTQLATGDPRDLRDSHPNELVRAFLRRGVPEASAA